jgi:hypothetical protein
VPRLISGLKALDQSASCGLFRREEAPTGPTAKVPGLSATRKRWVSAGQLWTHSGGLPEAAHGASGGRFGAPPVPSPEQYANDGAPAEPRGEKRSLNEAIDGFHVRPNRAVPIERRQVQDDADPD